MSDDDQILVVLPTLGERLEMLRTTLDSVDEQRSEVPLSLVVVLPARAGRARELAETRGARIVDDPGIGISHAINLGIQAATDETYYAWIGDDDLFRPHGLRRLLSLMKQHPTAQLAYGACDYIDDDGRTLFTNRAGELAKWLLSWGPDLIPHPGSLIRLDSMRKVGLFDTDLRYAMDLDLFLKLRRHGPFVSTTESVSAFRWHAESMTVSNRAASSAEARLVKRRYLHAAVRPLSFLWEVPVEFMAARAAMTVSMQARKPSSGEPVDRSSIDQMRAP